MQTPLLLFLGDLGASEIMLILVVILIFFGARRIPELARGLGTGIREFRDATREARSEIETADLPPVRLAADTAPVMVISRPQGPLTIEQLPLTASPTHGHGQGMA